MAEKPEIGITNWFKEILGVEFTFHHFIRENVPLAFGGYFLLEQREMSSWPLFSFQDTLLQMFNDPFPMSLPSHILFSLAGACWLLNYTTVNTTVLFKQASLTKKSFNFYETSLCAFFFRLGWMYHWFPFLWRQFRVPEYRGFIHMLVQCWVHRRWKTLQWYLTDIRTFMWDYLSSISGDGVTNIVTLKFRLINYFNKIEVAGPDYRKDHLLSDSRKRPLNVCIWGGR